MARFESTEIVWDVRNRASGQKFTVVTDDNRQRIRVFFEEQPATSTLKVSQQLSISKILARENSGVSSIQDPNVLATKGGRHCTAVRFRKPCCRGT